jgi:hypothetical protein
MPAFFFTIRQPPQSLDSSVDAVRLHAQFASKRGRSMPIYQGTQAEIMQALADHIGKLNERVTAFEDRAKAHFVLRR